MTVVNNLRETKSRCFRFYYYNKKDGARVALKAQKGIKVCYLER